MSRVEGGELVQCPKAPRDFTPPAAKRINQKSTKLVAAEAVYVKNRAIQLTQSPICQRCTIRPASHVHHILPRSAGGGHDLHNLLSVCDGPFYETGGIYVGCHAEIHGAPADAYREGWMRRKHPKPGDHHYYEAGGE